MGLGISERFNDPDEQQRDAMENMLANLRVAMPGIVQSFDPATQTATVQPAINENVKIGDGERQAMSLPVLSDIPVQFPRGGGYSLTLPIRPGDECLLVFSDSCIDGWWQSGGIQNQMERRRHDLSDATAIMGITSTPRAVPGYSSDTLQVRSDDGSTFIELDGKNISIQAETITVHGDLVVDGEATIYGIAFTPHVHGGVVTGGDTTEAPK